MYKINKNNMRSKNVNTMANFIPINLKMQIKWLLFYKKGFILYTGTTPR